MNEPLIGSWPAHARALSVGDLRVDLRYRRVAHARGDTELTQRCYDLLLLFLAEPGRLHTRARLLERIWAGVVVEDANLSQSVWMLRRALGDERKSWIRTVAKSGYVFEPAGPLRVELDAPEPAPAPADAPAAAVAPARLPAPIRNLRRPHAIAALVAAALAAGVGAWRLAAAPQANVPLRVVLLDVADAGTPLERRWPVGLLHAWTEWKLSSFGELVTYNAADVAADPAPGASQRIVLLSAGAAPDDAARLELKARFEGSDLPPLVESGAPEQAVALIDALSARIVAQLAPAHAGEPWPRLRADAAAARRYVEAQPAREQRRWSAYAHELRTVVDAAPDFALARLQLAQALSALGQKQAAAAELDQARARLEPLPPPAAQLVDARRLALGAQHADAAAAFARLAALHPAQLNLKLEHARALTRSGRAADAVAALADPAWQRQPADVRIGVLLARADAELAFGDTQAARRSAAAAEALATSAGWDFDAAWAALLLAAADTTERGEAADAGMYETAARRFETAGDGMNALRARLAGEAAQPHAPLAHLDALLAQARAAGYHRLEIETLRQAAFQRYRAGDIAAYRTTLAQGAEIARQVDDPMALLEFELDRVNTDLLMGDFAAAERRIAALRAQPLQGVPRYWIENFAANLDYRRGRFAAALAAAERIAPADRSAGPAAALLDCTRGDLLLVTGAPTQARMHYARCAGPAQATHRAFAALGLAELALLSADADEAKAQLQHADAQRAQLPSRPDGWIADLGRASLLARSGSIAPAEALYRAVLAPAHANGLRSLEAEARLGLAECALARDARASAQTELDAAGALLPDDDWLGRRRLRLARALAAWSGGDRPAAARMLAAIDRDAQARGDVVAELWVHSVGLLDPTLAACSAQRHGELLARSGLRGASERWMAPRAARLVALQLASEREGP